MTFAIPEDLRHGGAIVRRQTTFWDVTANNSMASWRIHFVRKAELRFVAKVFDHLTLVDEHPLLMDHREPTDSLFISSRAEDPDQVLLELSALSESHFDNWRPLAQYLNPDYSPRALLAEGSGMLLRGPRSFVEASTALLVRRGIRVDEPSSFSRMASGSLEVLLLGTSFVIAEQFRFERAR